MPSILHLNMGEFYPNIEKIVQKQMYENDENSFRKYFSLLIFFSILTVKSLMEGRALNRVSLKENLCEVFLAK